MKTELQVNEIMKHVPEEWRAYWCGARATGCGCLGCVQTGVAQIGNGAEITLKEWEEWMSKNKHLYLREAKKCSCGEVFDVIFNVDVCSKRCNEVQNLVPDTIND